MNYGARILMGSPRGRARFRGGNAAPDAATMGAIFGNQSRGGGIFSQGVGEYFTSGLSGIGEYFESTPRPMSGFGADTPSSPMPWKEYSAETARVQGLLNPKLKASGYCPVDVDGKLGPATCGGLNEVWPEMLPGTCQSMTPPSKGPCGGSTPSPSPSPGPSPGPAPAPAPSPAPTTAKMSGENAILLLGLGVVAGGAFLFFKKKRRRR